MSSTKRPTVFVLGLSVVTLLGWIGVATAKSHSVARNIFAGECGTKVAELEAEVRSLREQLRVMTERQYALSSSSNANPSSKTDSNVRTGFVGNGFAIRESSNSCTPPFVFDRNGIKYYFPECLESKVPELCSVPFAYNNAGIKSYKPGCLDDKPAIVSCDPPFRFDSGGLKSYKPECL
jgi:hypothetical protein